MEVEFLKIISGGTRRRQESMMRWHYQSSKVPTLRKKIKEIKTEFPKCQQRCMVPERILYHWLDLWQKIHGAC